MKMFNNNISYSATAFGETDAFDFDQGSLEKLTNLESSTAYGLSDAKSFCGGSENNKNYTKPKKTMIMSNNNISYSATAFGEADAFDFDQGSLEKLTNLESSTAYGLTDAKSFCGGSGNNKNYTKTKISDNSYEVCRLCLSDSDEENSALFHKDARRRCTRAISYFIVYSARCVVKVGKKAFSKVKGIHLVNITLNNKYCFTAHFNKQSATKFFNANFAESQLGTKAEPQILASSIGKAFAYAALAVKAIDTFVTIGNSPSMQFVAKAVSIDLKKLYDEFVARFFKIISKATNAVSSIIASLRELYDFIVNKVVPAEAQLFAESFLGGFAPTKLLNFIVNCQKVSSLKLLDNFPLVSAFIDALVYISESVLVPLFGSFFDIKVILDMVGFLKQYRLISEMNFLNSQFASNADLMVDSVFRERVKKVQKEASTNLILRDLVAKSPSSNSIYNAFMLLIKKVDSCDTIGRVEPTCFVFEGPPGTLKSVIMNQMTSIFNKPVYTHTVKSVYDGKDFYDTYNNEPIFCMDDVGQQGISQWRTIINMVAPIKYPLDCANVALKDTKYFCSETLLLTTNNLRNLGVPLRNEGISDISALYRRCCIFSFDHIVNKDGCMTGRIDFMTYNLGAKRYETTFPDFVINKFKEFKVAISPSFHCTVSNRLDLLKWIKTIMDCYSACRKSINLQNTLSETDVSTLREDIFSTPQLSFLNYTSELAGIFLQRFGKFFYPESFKTECIVGILCYALYKFLRYCADSFFDSGAPIPVLRSRNLAVNTVRSGQFEADFIVDGVVYNGCCLMSGHMLVTVAHNLHNVDKMRVIVYKNRGKNVRFIDNKEVSKVYMNVTADISIFSLSSSYPTPFKNLSKFFSDNSNNLNNFLSTPLELYDLDDIVTSKRGNVYYKISVDKDNRIPLQDITYGAPPHKYAVSYKFGGYGLCGSLVISHDGKIRGMHVAGNGTKDGYSVIYSKKTLEKISEILAADTKYCLDVDIKPLSPSTMNFSGIKIDKDYCCFSPKKTSIVKSPLFGVFPVTREPVDMTFDGAHSIKTIDLKGYKPVVTLCEDEVKFCLGMLVSEFGIKPFRDLNDNSIIKGTTLLAGLNRKSSNGMFCMPLKSDYVDFEAGEFTPLFQSSIKDYEDRMNAGDITCEDIVWKSCLKDEVRNIEKCRVPRSFKISRFHVQVLTKKYFGSFVESILSNRKNNQIMVGCNPYKDWADIYSMMRSCQGVWAGDIGSYDACMLPQLQDALNEYVMRRYDGGNERSARFILESLPCSLTAINDDVYLSTHSMPSGTFLTAIFNSLINRMYTYIWFYRYFKGKKNFSNFSRYVIDYVYGDDKLNGIRLVDEKSDCLNAVTMRDCFASFNMKFTDAFKKDISCPFEDVEALSFLKRTFVYNSALDDIVCPLDLRSIFSSLSWVDSKKDIEQVMTDKICSFQREMFLHEHLYAECVETLEKACVRRNIPIKLLSRDYLIDLYSNDKEAYFDHLEKYL